MLIIIIDVPALIALLYVFDQELIFVWFLQLEDVIEEMAASFVQRCIHKIDVRAADFGGRKENVRNVCFAFTPERSNECACGGLHDVCRGHIRFIP